MDSTAIAKNQYEAPRWAGVSAFVQKTANALGLRCEISAEKGWIRERGVFEVSGESGAVVKFMRAYDNAIEQYKTESR